METTDRENGKTVVVTSGILGGVAGMVGSILGSVSDLVTSIIGEVKSSRAPGEAREGK